jgi:hypothetical protein
MQKIPLMLAKPGMVIARDIYRNDTVTGIPICGKGADLTDSLIDRLGHLDIKSLYVEGHPVREEGDRSIEDLLRELDLRFEKVRQDPLTEKLYEIYADYLKRSMGESGERKAE